MTEQLIFVDNPLDERYLIDPDHTNVNQAVELAPQQEKDGASSSFLPNCEQSKL